MSNLTKTTGQTIESWVNEQMVETEFGPLTMIGLVHLKGAMQDEIDSVKFAKGGKQWVPKDLARRLRGKAESYAQDLPGRQQFLLLAFFDGKDEPQAKKPYSVLNVGRDTEDLGTEAPTTTGMTQQMMRHQETMFQMGVRHQESLNNNMMGIVNMFGQMLTQSLQENRTQREMLTNLLVQQQDRQHERDMQQLQFQRSTMTREKILSYLPALANTILGKEIFPQGTADTALIEQICENMPIEMVAQLGSALPSELMGPLMARFNLYMEKKENEKRKMAQLTPPQAYADPEGEASGDVINVQGSVSTNGRQPS